MSVRIIAIRARRIYMPTSEMLTNLDLFQGLPNDTLEAIADLCSEVSFAAKTVIFAEGRPADRIYVLLDGTVDLTISPTSLPEPMTIARLKTSGPGFGWSAVVGSGYYTATAHAVTDMHAIALDGRALVAHLEQNPCDGFVMMQRMAQIVSHRLGTIRTLLMETICD
jgi:CRP-like cAMP-binding protein